jgi:DNA-binding NarL/FixJ family response regulator
MNPRILLADNHALVLEAISRMLRPRFTVVGTAANGREVVAATRRLQPDVVVMDVSMPVLNGLDAGRQIKKLRPETKLVYLTVHGDPEIAAEALNLGASGFVLKTSAASELFQAVDQALSGAIYITPLVSREAIQKVHGTAVARKLTARQREVLQLLAEGHTMKQAAALLRVTSRTIAFHKYRIMQDHSLATNADLFQLAVKVKLVSVS